MKILLTVRSYGMCFYKYVLVEIFGPSNTLLVKRQLIGLLAVRFSYVR